MEKQNSLPNYYILKRGLAGLLDYILYFTLFYISCLLFGEKTPTGGFTGNHLFFFFFGIWILLMVISEILFESTLGNFLFGLKAVRKNGEKMNFWQPLVRHCTDLIDMWPLGLVGILTIKFTKKNQRLGDIIAETIVVERNKTEKNALQHRV
ncbi:RDD family protein, partial [Psychroserpens sp. BH13MA-6]